MKRRIFGAIGFLLVIATALTACSNKMSKNDMATSDVSAPYYAEYDSAGNYSGASPEEAKGDVMGLTTTSSWSSANTAEQIKDKIIRRFYLDVETQEFDSLINTIGSEIDRLGGYVESSQIRGRRYNYSNESRYGDIVARIPGNKVDEFVATVDGKANVINKQETTENVSLEYIDIESRIEALEIEQDRLFAILEKEDSLDNIVILESRLSEVRYELQNYESKLRYYDDQVNYSTVTLQVHEVERITPVTKEKQTVGERIKNGFSETMYDLGTGLQNFFVWFVVNLPYILIWAAIITVIVIVIRRLIKKDNERRAAMPIPQPMPYYGQPNQGPVNGQFNQKSTSKDNQNQEPADKNEDK